MGQLYQIKIKTHKFKANLHMCIILYNRQKMKCLTTVNFTGTSIYFYYGYRNRPVLYKLLIIGMFYEFVHNFQAIILKLDPLELCQILLYRLDTPTNYRQKYDEKMKHLLMKRLLKVPKMIWRWWKLMLHFNTKKTYCGFTMIKCLQKLKQ